MPRRSNEFQRLIHLIETTLAEHGAVVHESEMIPSRQGELREVDVAVHLTNGAHRMIIAIECRDHNRPASLEWIDALIGKYEDMPTDRIVAVSRKGFTAGATRKAAANGVECWTLAQAQNAAQWLDHLGMRTISVRARELILDQCTLVAPTVEGTQPLDLDTVVLRTDGHAVPLKEIPEWLRQSDRLMQRFQDAFLAAERANQPPTATITIVLSEGSRAIDDKGVQVPATTIRLTAHCVVEDRELEYQPATYANQDIAHFEVVVGELRLSSVITAPASGQSRLGVRAERVPAKPTNKQ